LSRPPSPTPFPYTTLFRSPETPAAGRCGVGHSFAPGAAAWPFATPAPANTARTLSQQTAAHDSQTPNPQLYPDHPGRKAGAASRSEEHTSELQSLTNLVCR